MPREGREHVTRVLKPQMKPPFRKRGHGDKHSVLQKENILRRKGLIPRYTHGTRSHRVRAESVRFDKQCLPYPTHAPGAEVQV